MKRTNKKNVDVRKEEREDTKNTPRDRGRTRSLKKESFSAYNQIPNLVEQTAGISGIWPTGDTIAVPGAHHDGVGGTSVPAIMAIQHAPLFGSASQPDDPLTVAMLQIDTFVRQGLSGTRYYDAADLGMHLLACGEVLALSEYIKRAFGVAHLYSAVNRYLPTTLLAAMNIDPDYLLDNRLYYIGKFNDVLASIQGLVIPSTFGYYYERVKLYQNYYMDSDNARDQLYVVNPLGFYVMDWTNKRLKWVTIKEILSDDPDAISDDPARWRLKIERLIDFLREMVQAILGNGVESSINTELLRVFGDNRISIELFDHNSALAPVFDLNTLEAIHNGYVFNHAMLNNDSMHIVSDYTGTNFTQGLSCARVTPSFVLTDTSIADGLTNEEFADISYGLSAHFSMAGSSHIITSFDELTPIRKVELTRFKPTFYRSYNEDRDETTYKVTSGTGILFNPVIWKRPLGSVHDADLTTETVAHLSQILVAESTTAFNALYSKWHYCVAREMMNLACASQFRFAPFQFVIRLTTQQSQIIGSVHDAIDVFGDSQYTDVDIFTPLNNWVTVSHDDVYHMNMTALRSLLYPPFPKTGSDSRKR